MTTQPTTLDLDAIEARARAAEPGPWRTVGDIYVYAGGTMHLTESTSLTHSQYDRPATQTTRAGRLSSRPLKHTDALSN